MEMQHRAEEAVLRETIHQLSRNGLVVVACNVLGSIVIGAYFWWQTQSNFFISWIIGMIFMLGLRTWLISEIVNASTDKFRYGQKLNYFCLGTLFTGLGWSLLAAYIYLYTEASLHGVMYFCVAGVVATGLATNAASTRAFASFALPIILPLAVLHITFGGMEEKIFGTFLVIFAGVVLFTSRHIAQFISESTTYNFENKELLTNLVKEKEHIMMLNDRLNHDLKKRVGVMEWLATGRHDHGDLTEEMHLLSSQDALTGLANRRRFNDQLKTEWARSRRDQCPVALIKCDIDHFQSFNDSLGQQEGDLCLSTVANCLSRFARRTTDLIARYGEDEFVVLLPGIAEADAVPIAEEIRTAILRQNIPHPDPQESSQVTLTLGVSALTPSRHNTEMTLIKQADIALYRAKQQGRNRVISYSVSDQMKKVTLRDLIRPLSQKQD